MLHAEKEAVSGFHKHGVSFDDGKLPARKRSDPCRPIITSDEVKQEYVAADDADGRLMKLLF